MMRGFNIIYPFIAGELGCFKINNDTKQRGCSFECEDPNDCKKLNQGSADDLPTLKLADKIGNGDICICTGNLCNNIWWSGWEIFGFVVAGISGFLILSCLLCFLCIFKGLMLIQPPVGRQ